ncbi:chaperonin 10-like protein [Xylariales sp. AK1849]|nr:chaperonin 10-like protein [Xylariales sp. AK1849]
MPKQVIVQSSLETVEIIDTPIPIPKNKEVVIKVVVSGTNPKTGNIQKNLAHNSGDDTAGFVHSVGNDVYEFKPGDRVAAMHDFREENGSFAEYAVAPDWNTFHIPQTVSFEEAATIPVAAVTAAIALYVDMKLPAPYDSRKPAEGGERVPLLIYGVTSAVGAFAAKLVRLSGLRPIIGIAGRAGGYVSTLIDHVVDYRKGEDALVVAIEEILAKEGLGSKVPNVFDAISEGGSLEATLRFLDPNGDGENFKHPTGVHAYNSAVPEVHSTQKDFGYLWSRYLGRLLEDGRLKAHPYEVIPGGLNGILAGLQNLRARKASAIKYVYRIERLTTLLSLQGPSKQNSGASAQSKPPESTKPLRKFPFPGQT